MDFHACCKSTPTDSERHEVFFGFNLLAKAVALFSVKGKAELARTPWIMFVAEHTVAMWSQIHIQYMIC